MGLFEVLVGLAWSRASCPLFGLVCRSERAGCGLWSLGLPWCGHTMLQAASVCPTSLHEHWHGHGRRCPACPQARVRRGVRRCALAPCPLRVGATPGRVLAPHARHVPSSQSDTGPLAEPPAKRTYRSSPLRRPASLVNPQPCNGRNQAHLMTLRHVAHATPCLPTLRGAALHDAARQVLLLKAVGALDASLLQHALELLGAQQHELGVPQAHGVGARVPAAAAAASSAALPSPGPACVESNRAERMQPECSK